MLSRASARLSSLALAALMATGCSHVAGPLGAAVKNATAYTAKRVTPGFMWGVSTAGYQWEGGDTTSSWAAWDKAGKTSERNPNGADGWHRYGEDADLASGLGCNAFRTSIEWSRIEPVEGQYDPAAIAHYHELLAKLHANGLEPVVTLMHFAYPHWLDAQGGWENPATAEKFARYAAFVAKEFGPQIKFYLTYNEPNVFLLGGWVAAMTPPGKMNPLAGLRALNTMVKGHTLAYDAIHGNDPQAMVSFNMYNASYHVALNQPGFNASPAGEEDQAKEHMTSGTYFMDQVAGGSQHGHLDYVAFDYYCKLDITPTMGFPRQDTWNVYPDGFYNAMKGYYQRYKVPVLVAENGMATWNATPRADHWTRSSYIVAHVSQVQRAINEGVPMLGYIHWSITDNYEWGSFSPRFGLYNVNCRQGDYTRTPADGVDAYRSVIAAGGVNNAIAARFPAPSPGGLPAPWEPGGGSAVVGF